ncbi:TetR/AcrR family transcriptional regulator [Gordonia zhenghanii]|uniref:TetR/AcrR family transcriptional regulator n=1 Tax=Gordonia zhenghanii TaxID=2911516 RepID=UPI0027DFBECD|nr:TetR/AcrR family transcriptional regulator [Gordonia zhenghanii]
MEPTDRRRRRTHAAVLDAAADLFASRGFRQTSVDELAEVADVALSSIYANFPGGKADVYAALACRIASVHADEMTEAIAGAEEPVELAVFDAYLRFHTARPAAFRILGLSDLGPDDSDLFVEARRRVHELLGGVLAQAVSASSSDPRTARAEALRLWSAVNGLIALRTQGFASASEVDAILATVRSELAARVAGR